MVQATTWGVPTSEPQTPTTMATRMDDSLDAGISSHSGAARPSYAMAGTIWLDTSVASAWVVYLYDGTDDIALFTVDPTSDAAEVPAEVLPDGAVVDSVLSSYATYNAVTVVIPLDDTIPQNTEGSQILSASITPKSTTNKLRITVVGNMAATAVGGASGIAAVLSGASANALAAAVAYSAELNVVTPIALIHEYVPGSTSAQTITVRIGTGNAAFPYAINGQSARLMGGVQKWTLLVEEIKA